MVRFVTMVVLALMSAGSVSAFSSSDEWRLSHWNFPNRTIGSASAMIDDLENMTGEQTGQRALLAGSVDLRRGTISSTLLYSGDDFLQFTFVLPNNVRQVKIQSRGGSATNFCHVGWSASLTGSAVDAGTIEAFRHLPRIAGNAAGTNANDEYEWDNIQTRGGFSTLYCSCTDTAAIGVSGGIMVEYIRQ